MKMLNQIRAKAKPWRRNIAILVSDDVKMLQGAVEIEEAGFASITLIGDKTNIQNQMTKLSVDSSALTIVDCKTDFRVRPLVHSLMETSLATSLTFDEAYALVTTNPVVFSALFVKCGFADGLIVGDSVSYEELAKIGEAIVGLRKNTCSVSSTSIMLTNTPEYGEKGLLFFGDCHVNPCPTPEELCDAAISTVRLARAVFQEAEPKVSLLSFSTKGSAKDPLVDKVVATYDRLKAKQVDFKFDGELQLDASIEPSVGYSKAPGSVVAGEANILIFPDLQAGNIGFNIVKVLGNATVFGPFLQGLAKPIHRVPDCFTVEDLVNFAAVVAVESTL